MNNALEMRDLTTAEIDSVIGASGGISINLNIIVAPQVNAGASVATSIFGDAQSFLAQNNLGINAIQSNFHL